MGLGFRLGRTRSGAYGGARACGGVDLEQGAENEAASKEQEQGSDDLNGEHGPCPPGPSLLFTTVRTGPEFRLIFAFWQEVVGQSRRLSRYPPLSLGTPVD